MSSYLPFTAIDTELFPANYASGRERWLAELGGEMLCFSYPCPGASPEGEALLLIPSGSAQKMLKGCGFDWWYAWN